MGNNLCALFTFVVCVLALTIVPAVLNECSNRPEYRCKNFKDAIKCDAVDHCIKTVWEIQNASLNEVQNYVSNKIIQLFKDLKNVREIINQPYLRTQVAFGCQDITNAAFSKLCKENTEGLEKYIHDVLLSDTTPETMCVIMGLCNNEAMLDNDNQFGHDINEVLEDKQVCHRKPMKPLSGIFWFNQDMGWDNIKANNPQFSDTDVAKELSRLWLATDNDTKAKYEAIAKVDKKRYEREMIAYEALQQEYLSGNHCQ